MIYVLVEGTIDFLAAQIVAGAEVVQLFDRWAGIMPERRASAGESSRRAALVAL